MEESNGEQNIPVESSPKDSLTLTSPEDSVIATDPQIAPPSTKEENPIVENIINNGDLSINHNSVVPAITNTTTSSEMEVSCNGSAMEGREEQKVKVETVRKKAVENASKNVYQHIGLIDTRAPFESVKEAVSKFGGITDWKAHKAETLERSKQIRIELEKLQEDIPLYKIKSESVESAKSTVLTELESTKRLVEELKLNLEKAQTEESQAKQDSELALLRAQEIEQGITDDDSSIAAKAQLDLAKKRHESAVQELQSVQLEFVQLQEQYGNLVRERDLAVSKAEQAVSESREMERRVEELTLELISAKENLEMAHSTHLEAEEHRIGASLAREQDCMNWEKEIKQAEEELRALNEQYLVTKELKSKLSDASASLIRLKTELVAYMETKLNEELSNEMEGREGASEMEEMKRAIKGALDTTRKELEEVKGNIDKTRNEVSILRVAVDSLKSELEREKMELLTLQQREGMASIALSSLEAELDRTKEELEVVRSKERETREKMTELPKLLQQAAQEADDAKLSAQWAQDELKKAQEESEQARAGLSTTETRLRAAMKEIEASRASETLALNAIKALQESEETISLGEEESPRGVTLPLEEYYSLSKQAHDAEEQAHERVATALSQVELAKESEAKCLERLNETYKQMEEKKEGMRLALDRAERAREGKLAGEMELRKWRENEQRRRANEAATKATVTPMKSPPRSVKEEGEREEGEGFVGSHKTEQNIHHGVVSPRSERKLRRKKSLFPRIVMFIARKKGERVK